MQKFAARIFSIHTYEENPRKPSQRVDKYMNHKRKMTARVALQPSQNPRRPSQNPEIPGVFQVFDDPIRPECRKIREKIELDLACPASDAHSRRTANGRCFVTVLACRLPLPLKSDAAVAGAFGRPLSRYARQSSIRLADPGKPTAPRTLPISANALTNDRAGREERLGNRGCQPGGHGLQRRPQASTKWIGPSCRTRSGEILNGSRV